MSFMWLLMLLSYGICDGTFTVWSDGLNGITNGNWNITGLTNPTHSSRYCPTSNDCLQLHPQSSIQTSIPTDNYQNMTITFGVTIVHKSQNSSLNPHDYCRIYYKPIQTSSTTNWNLIASFTYDTTSDFNNKLPAQSYPLFINEYYDSIEIQFLNTANQSIDVSCYIDQLSLTADFYNAPPMPSEPFKINLLYIVIAMSLSILVCVFGICLIWLYFRFTKGDRYISKIQALKIESPVFSQSSNGKTPTTNRMSSLPTPMSADLVTYHTQTNSSHQTKQSSDEASLLEQFATLNGLTTVASLSHSKCRTDEHLDNVGPMPNVSNAGRNPALSTSNSTNTIVKLDRIMDEVLGDNHTMDTDHKVRNSVIPITNTAPLSMFTETKTQTSSTEPITRSPSQNPKQNSMPSSRRDTDISTPTITAFNPIQLSSYDLYEESKNGKVITPTPVNDINDDLEFKSVNHSAINPQESVTYQSSVFPLVSNASTTFKGNREHNSLSLAENDLSFVSGLKNRYPSKSPKMGGNNDSATFLTQFSEVPDMTLLNHTTEPSVSTANESNNGGFSINKKDINNDYISYVDYFGKSDCTGAGVSSKKIRFNPQKYAQNAEEDSLDIGSVVTSHTVLFDNHCVVEPIVESRNGSRMSQSKTEMSFRSVEESQKL